jgi:hypothetical protein
MDTAEKYAVPVHGNLGGSFVRTNDFNEKFYLRWGKSNRSLPLPADWPPAPAAVPADERRGS